MSDDADFSIPEPQPIAEEWGEDPVFDSAKWVDYSYDEFIGLLNDLAGRTVWVSVQSIHAEFLVPDPVHAHGVLAEEDTTVVDPGSADQPWGVERRVDQVVFGVGDEDAFGSRPASILLRRYEFVGARRVLLGRSDPDALTDHVELLVVRVAGGLRIEMTFAPSDEVEIASEPARAHHAEYTPRSMSDLLVELANTGRHETYPVATEADVAHTEKAIGHELPGSYRKFVREFSNGAYLYRLQEVSGVGTTNEPIRTIQDNDWHKLRRIDGREPIPFWRSDETVAFEQLVPFSADSNGNTWCFIAGDPDDARGEYRVAYFSSPLAVPGDERKLYVKLSGFTEWLQILVEERVEVIRTFTQLDDDLDEELGLG